MKKILIITLCVLIATTALAGQITKKWTFSSGSTIESAKVNENFDDLFTVINGAIEGGTSGNIAADTLTEREMADEINPRVRWDEGFQDFTYTGLQPATSASLTSNISAGTAYVDGYRVNKASATSHTYTASKVTYVDISKTGVFTYSETAFGAAAPALTANSTRVAAVESSAAAITNVTDMRTLTPYTTSSMVQVVNNTADTTFGPSANLAWGAVATGSTVVAFDDSIPQKTEGDQYMQLAITPTYSTSKLKIEVVWMGANNAANNLVVALFKDTDADAIACAAQTAPDADNIHTINLTHYMDSPGTGTYTFKVRAGGNGVGTTTFNGNGGARKYGGVMASSMTITEIQ